MNKDFSVPPVGHTARPLRILCADDDRMIRDIVQLALTRDGHQVTAVDDGSRAHELVAEAPADYDLVITDHQMPVMTGLELVTCLRALPYHGGILVMSGSIGQALTAEYQALGVDALLDKPVRLQLLRTTVRSVTDRRAALPAAV
jgi:CheY-like chemotaxis protein